MWSRDLSCGHVTQSCGHMIMSAVCLFHHLWNWCPMIIDDQLRCCVNQQLNIICVALKSTLPIGTHVICQSTCTCTSRCYGKYKCPFLLIPHQWKFLKKCPGSNLLLMPYFTLTEMQNHLVAAWWYFAYCWINKIASTMWLTLSYWGRQSCGISPSCNP